MDAGPGIEPGSGAYETPVLPLLYPAITGLRCKNRTCATWSQTTDDTISPIGEKLEQSLRFPRRYWVDPNTVNIRLHKKLGAPRQNRTAITGLQNPCTTIVLVGRNLVDRERIELSISGCKPDVFPLALTAHVN